MKTAAAVCPACGQPDWDLQCINCEAFVCGFCGQGDAHGDGSCCPTGDHCSCQTVFGKWGGFTQPCLQSACLPWVAAFIELVSWLWQDFQAIDEADIQVQAIRETVLTGAPHAMVHYQLWRSPEVAARYSARALSRQRFNQN